MVVERWRSSRDLKRIDGKVLPGPELIDHGVVSDGEEPRSESGAFRIEPANRADHIQEGGAGRVLGCRPGQTPIAIPVNCIDIAVVEVDKGVKIVLRAPNKFSI